MELGQGSGNSSPTLCEGHRGIFNMHQLMLADRTPSFTSIQGTAHRLMKHGDETLGQRFKPRLDSLEVSVRTSWPPYQSLLLTSIGNITRDHLEKEKIPKNPSCEMICYLADIQ